MGGQACVFYGAAEFSRDCDIVIVADDENLSRLARALDDLQADCIAVPPFERKYLEAGHAIHFRCMHPEAENIRLDVMTKMRGCAPFDALWERRTTVEDSEHVVYEILGIEDLVQAKKTQRDKDWLMLRRLIDAHHEQFLGNATDEQFRFWLRESRTPSVLIDVASQHPGLALDLLKSRPLLIHAINRDASALKKALDQEIEFEKSADEVYWRPLKKELEELRAVKRNKG
jgi:hypothetical protein